MVVILVAVFFAVFVTIDLVLERRRRTELARQGQVLHDRIREAQPHFAAGYEMPEGFVEQPMNLNVVDRLLSCFASDYGEAYAGSCDREHRGRD